MLITLLSGCVKIENTLNLSELESIKNNFKIESKYISKFAWQVKFEERIKDELFGKITTSKSNFSLENKTSILQTLMRFSIKSQILLVTWQGHPQILR